MSAERIDVLAVMHDCAIALANEDACGHAAELTDARAAVAELIAADKALDAANHLLAVTDPRSEDADTMESMRVHRDRCRARRAAALARCGGAS